MRSIFTRLFMGLAFVAALCPTVALADQIAIDQTSAAESYPGSEYTLGFEFSPTTNISVTALGTFDNGAPLTSTAQVGIWNTAGTLLTSTTVPTSGAIMDGLFAFQSITPFALQAGTDYIIGSYGTGLQSSLNTSQGGTGSINPDIFVVEDRFSNFNSAFSFPDTTNAAPQGAWLGANFLFNAQAAVPEPLTLSIFGAGLAGVAAMRRRKKAAKA